VCLSAEIVILYGEYPQGFSPAVGRPPCEKSGEARQKIVSYTCPLTAKKKTPKGTHCKQLKFS